MTENVIFYIIEKKIDKVMWQNRMRCYLMYDIVLYQFKVFFTCNVKVVSHSIERKELDA